MDGERGNIHYYEAGLPGLIIHILKNKQEHSVNQNPPESDMEIRKGAGMPYYAPSRHSELTKNGVINLDSPAKMFLISESGHPE